jgi:hypothetical protein
MKTIAIGEVFCVANRTFAFDEKDGALMLRVADSKSASKKKEFQPPTLAAVKQYFKDEGYREDVAIRAFNHYEKGGWKDSNGKQVKNWKQKMYTNWMKDENKIKAAKPNDGMIR